MKKLSIYLTILLFSASATQAQQNFTYSPEKPQAGDSITIYYTPGNDLAGLLEVPEAIVYQMGSKQLADDFSLRRSQGKFTGTFKTDTSANFVYLSFSIENKFDNNRNEGFWIQLHNGDSVKKGSYLSQSLYFQYYGEQAGVESDNKKALAAYEKEFELYPESKKNNLISYLRLYNSENTDKGQERILQTIEAHYKDTIKEETDYATLESLYRLAKLPQQSRFIGNLKKDKFPEGKWKINETVNSFYDEKDIVKKEALYTEILKNIKEKEDWKYLESSIPSYSYYYLYLYVTEKKWEDLGNKIGEVNLGTEPKDIAMWKNYLVTAMLKDSTADLKLLDQLAASNLSFGKSEIQNPSATKPASATATQWQKRVKSRYADYLANYALIQYKQGLYKQALPNAKEAAITLSEGKNINQNNTYVLIAEKTLSAKKLQKQLEDFVKEGKATSEIKETLKRNYTKRKKSDKGFDEYITALERESFLKLVADLKKKIIDEPAPTFALNNLKDENIDLADLKGKIVIVDFWATWCGPCINSFPGMQKAQDKYKDDPNVKFLFVNTWEDAADKKKNAADFIEKYGYTFDVPLDTKDEIIAAYKVDGIPTKFIIDRKGNIRFKSVGFDGNTEKLVQEITAMVDLADGKEIN